MYKHHGLKSSVEKSRRVEPLLGLGFFSMGLVRAIRLPFLKITAFQSFKVIHEDEVSMRTELHFSASSLTMDYFTNDLADSTYQATQSNMQQFGRHTVLDSIATPKPQAREHARKI